MYLWDEDKLTLPGELTMSETRLVQDDESVGITVELLIETKIRLYIHYIYSHTTNLYES